MSLAMAGVLMSLAHSFRLDDFEVPNGIWGFFIASLGMLIFIPLCLKPLRARDRFFMGWWGAFWFFCVTLYWLVNALREFGGLDLWVAVVVSGLLAAYCSLFFGVWAAIAGSRALQEKSAIVRIIGWASLWAALEAARQYFLTGFHWGELGYHFDYLPIVRDSAALWGVHGLTFWWVFFIGVILHFDQFQGRWLKLAPTLSIFVLGMIFGKVSLHLGEPDQSLRVGIIQPNIAQEMKWDALLVAQNTDRLLQLTRDATLENPDLIVWPETAYPRLVGVQQKQLPFTSTVPLLVGAVVRDGAQNRNSALLVEGDQIQQRFDKRHLVPFGEFVPLQKWLPFKKLVANVGDFVPGERDQDLIRLKEGSVNLGPLICYEDIFSRLSVNLAREGAHVLVNMTNDAWYGRTSAQRQHAAKAAFQVYQTRLPMIRSTNNGLSTVITPVSRTDLEAFTELQSVIDLPYYSNPRLSIFTFTYPLMEWIWLVIFAIAVVWKRNPRTRKIFFRKSLS
jgi:apolipoprotein N-acyltransferase